MDKDTQLLLIGAVALYLVTRDRRPAYQPAAAAAGRGSSDFLSDLGSLIEKGIGAYNSYEDRQAARDLARRKQERADKEASAAPSEVNPGDLSLLVD